ncbi:hypothetical protein BCR41DRAFT_415753 [Lobosporangium transversale]|uniref:Uncharacterized protein n=2 Tax=Lobosporangium transversale TaxID=64571 RepID=A0A1Y2G6E8_9FUNG|nr:hypothetical protein BCR41DRAFT_415753 [Lobosporangium transversale]ORY98261.1 hypothetical protein BCR41DRAFT_415753 [Lobosporangium transversale]|eukprot:XP_021875690.1 hypothetical protein BCR41DRAFT_415753 [Lobosporangium transversale]
MLKEHLAKRCRSWKRHIAADGEPVDLPLHILDLIENNKYAPEPRTKFQSLLTVKGGDRITSMDLGQSPKFFAKGYQGREFFVTEQMMKLWNELENSEWSVQKCLSGPMGVGKSYISWFLVAKAYAHGWPVLYIADASKLSNCDTKTAASKLICQIFLSINKDILTASELKEMVAIETSKDPYVNSATCIFAELLQSRSQKALFVVDEHGALFPESSKSAPERFPFLGPLQTFNSWNNSNNARVVFSSTVRFAKLILRDASHYVEYVGPMSPDIFNKLLDVIIDNRYPTGRQHLNELRGEIQKATGCVPRELNIFFGEDIEGIELTANGIKQRLKDYEEDRKEQFLEILKNCYSKIEPIFQPTTRQALVDVFLQSKDHTGPPLDWRFYHFGIMYEYRNKGRSMIMKRPITPASEAALLGLYRLCPLPNDYICAARQNILQPAQFSDVFFQKLIKQNNIIFKSTNLAGKEEQLLELRVDGFEHLQDPPKRFGDEGKNILIHGGELPRFDFILGYTFIQVSISNFQKHNEGTAAIDLAFTDRKYSNGRNQIEYFLDYTYGGTHRAEMEITEVTKKTQAKNTGEGKSVIDKRDFKVTRDGVLCPDFMILYIRGKNDFDDKGNEVHRPNHTGKVQEYPQIRHVCWDEAKRSLFGDSL